MCAVMQTSLVTEANSRKPCVGGGEDGTGRESPGTHAARRRPGVDTHCLWGPGGGADSKADSCG